MKRLTALLSLALLVLGSHLVQAQTNRGAPAAGTKAAPATKPPPKPAARAQMVNIRGEILDLGCYLTKNLYGAAHRECALKCLLAGIPMGIITPDSVIYVLTQNHDRAMEPSGWSPPDPFAQCKGWPSYYAELRGYVREQRGVKAFEVFGAKLLGKTAAEATAATTGAAATPAATK